MIFFLFDIPFHHVNNEIMINKELSQVEKLLVSAKSESINCYRSDGLHKKLFAAKAIGEVEGYLKCLKENKLITSEQYAVTFDQITKYWNRIS